MWPWQRRRDDRPVRAEGAPIPDGDVILSEAYPRRWTELLAQTQELPVVVPFTRANPPATDTTELIRPFVRMRRGR